MRALTLILALTGCGERGKDVLASVGPRFRALNAQLTQVAAKLPKSPVTERLGVPLSPAAVIGQRLAGNTRLLDLTRLNPELSLCTNAYLDPGMEYWMELTEPTSLRAKLAAKASGDEAKSMRAHAEALLAARYVVLYRMIDCNDPDDSAGSTTVEAFLVDVTSSKVERVVRVAVQAGDAGLSNAVHDRLLGALAGRAGVEVQVPALSGGLGLRKIVPLTAPEPPPTPPTPTVAAAKTGLCKVDMPEAEVEDEGGGMPCAEAEALAKSLRDKGFAAKVLPMVGR